MIKNVIIHVGATDSNVSSPKAVEYLRRTRDLNESYGLTDREGATRQ